jgi:hypothetical protein
MTVTWHQLLRYNERHRNVQALWMKTVQTCPECDATWVGAATCQDHFHQMLAWEIENPSLGEVHHLMVLSYHLQHPSLYSPEGLDGAKQLLVDFLERGLTTSEVRHHIRGSVASDKRKFKIKGTAENHGEYRNPIHWTMTAADVIARGVDSYCDSVRAWAGSVLESLKASRNLASATGTI